jgi:hypothetical protein
MIVVDYSVLNQFGTPMFYSDVFANRPAAGITGRLFVSTDTKLWYRDTGSTWDLIGNVGTVTSVGLSMPSAFNVANSPITGSGSLNVTGAGTVSQYIRGDGTLADFPNTGGGSSVNYYLNGGTSQGSFGGNTYYQMSKTANTGTAANFTISANGYIAQFITNAGDPALLNIPAGNWNIQAYFSSNSTGGNPSFYVELYKYDGTTFSLIASSSSNPEVITGGTSIDLYYTSIAVPATVLTLTDRLAIRFYVTHDGRTITFYTQSTRLAQIATTFSTGITAINSATEQVQFLVTGTSGTNFNISTSSGTHTFNLPVASATNTGKLSSSDWSTFNSKQNAISLTTTGTSGAATFVGNTLNIPQYQGALTNPVTGTGTINELAYFTATGSTIGSLTTATYPSLTEISYVKGVTSAIQTQLNSKQATISLTTTGSSGAATFVGNTLNIPNYGSALSGYLPLTGGTLTGALNGTTAAFSGTLAGYALSVTNIEDSSQGLLVRSTDADTTLYLARFQSSASAVSQSWVDRFSIAKNGSAVFGDNTPVTNVTLYVKGSSTGASDYAFNVADTNGADIFWTRNDKTARFYGNVGIGKTPSVALDVVGAATLTGVLNGLNAIFTGNAASFTALQLTNNYYSTGAAITTINFGLGNANPYIAATLDGANSGNGRLKFYTSAGGSATLSMTLENNGQASFNASVLANNPSEGATGESLIAGRSFKIDATGAGQRAVSYMVSNTLSDTYGSGLQAQFANFAGDKAFGFNLNTSGGFELYTKSGGTFGRRLLIDATGASTFSSNITSNATIVTNYPLAINLNYAGSVNDIQLGAGTPLRIVNQAYNAALLQINNSGSTSFSSSVTGANATLTIENTVSTATSLLYFKNSAARQMLIGYTGPSYSAGEYGVIDVIGSYPLIFATADTERIRISSGGNVGIGSGSPTALVYSKGASTTESIYYAEKSTASFTGSVITSLSYTASGTGWNHFIGYSDIGSTTNIKIIGNGNIQNANNSYGSLSDIKLKENIIDATPKLDKLLKVKIRNYNLIGSEIKQIGVIAQELEEIFPSMIEETFDIDKKGNQLETTTKSVKYSVFVPMLIKAIQEQQAQIEELKQLYGKAN